MSLFNSTVIALAALCLLGGSKVTLAQDPSDIFPGTNDIWECLAETGQSCSEKGCSEDSSYPPLRIRMEKLYLRDAKFVFCPNAVDGCDNFAVSINPGVSYTTVRGETEDLSMMMRIRNRDGRFLRITSNALVSWNSYGICAVQD